MESASRTEKRNKGARPSDRKSEESCAFSDALSLLGRLGRLWGPSWRQPLGSSRGDEATRPEKRSRRRSETSNLQGRPRRHLEARRLSAAWFGSGPSSGSSGSSGSSRPARPRVRQARGSMAATTTATKRIGFKTWGVSVLKPGKEAASVVFHPGPVLGGPGAGKRPPEV